MRWPSWSRPLPWPSVVDRSLLHHATLRAVTPAIVVLGLAILVRAALHGAGDLSALRVADRVVATLRRQLLEHALARPGPARRGAPGRALSHLHQGLRSLHTDYARYLPQAAAAAVIPLILLVWVATQDWLSFVVVIALVLAVPVTMIAFGREATRRSERQWRRLGSLAGPCSSSSKVSHLARLRPGGAGTSRGRSGDRRRAVRHHAHPPRRLLVGPLHGHDRRLRLGFVAMVLGLRPLWGELGLQTAMAVLLVAPEIFIPLRRGRSRIPRQRRRTGGGIAGARGAGDAVDRE